MEHHTHAEIPRGLKSAARYSMTRNALAVAGCLMVVACAPSSVFGAITITSPVGGETWFAGNPVTVTWTSVDLPANVAVNILVRQRNDGPGAWFGFATGGDPIAFPVGDGTATFFVPTWLGDGEYFVELRVLEIGSISSSISASPVTVVGSTELRRLEILTPGHGVSRPAGSVQEITWSAQGVDTIVSLSVSDNLHGVASAVGPNGPFLRSSDGGVSWTIPDNIGNGASYRLLLLAFGPSPFAVRAGRPFDESPVFDVFASLPRPTVQVTFPNGGETLSASADHQICWASSETEGSVFLRVQSANGTRVVGLGVEQVAVGCFSWTPCPFFSGTDFRVVVSLNFPNGLGAIDESDADFTITPLTDAPTVTVTSPNGGEIFAAGSTQAITWDETGMDVSVGPTRLITTSNEGDAFRGIGFSPQGPGMANWLACPIDDVDALYRIQVCAHKAGCFRICDESDAAFDVLSPPTTSSSVSIVSPVAGEVWPQGVTRTIRWSTQNAAGMTVALFLSRFDSEFGAPFAQIPAEDGRFDWVVSPFLPSERTYRIVAKVLDGECPVATDKSGFFAINSVTCTCGDVNGDDFMDVTDFAPVGACLGQSPIMSTECLCSDLDGDQRVDMRDVAKMMNLFDFGSVELPPTCP